MNQQIDNSPTEIQTVGSRQIESSSFLISNKFFLGVWVGMHLFFRIMNWPGSYVWLFLIPALFAVYYLVQALVFLFQRRYQFTFLSLLISVLLVMISNKIFYSYFSLVLSLIALLLIGFKINKVLNTTEFEASFRPKVYELLTIVMVIQLIPDQILFTYASKTRNLRTWDTPVTYADFKKYHLQDHKYDATLYSRFYIWTSKVYHYPSIVSVTYMEPDSSSWRDLPQASTESDAELLMHEQLHFDITELWRRRMEDSVSRSLFLSYAETLSIIDYFYLKRNQMQYEYDSLTNHGTIVKEQLKWDQNIKYQLTK